MSKAYSKREWQELQNKPEEPVLEPKRLRLIDLE